MTIQLNTGISGHITMTAHGGQRGTVELADFKNLILNAGLDRMLGGSGFVSGTLDHCQVGTGNSVPSATQTALDARVASTTNIQVAAAVSYTAGPPDYLEFSQTYRFATGAAAGNLREVGFGWASTGSLFSRALTTNAGGTPTDVTVLADEQLDVTYRVRIYPPTADVTGNTTLDGVSTNYVIRASRVSDVLRWDITHMLARSSFGATVAVGSGNSTTRLAVYSGAIGTRTSFPAGTETAQSGLVQTPSAYTNGSFFRDIMLEWGLNDGNVGGGFQSLTFGPGGSTGGGEAVTMRFQMQFTPNVAKDATKRLRLTFRYAFTRL